MSDNCECEYCINQDKRDKCWVSERVDTLKSKVTELTATNSAISHSLQQIKAEIAAIANRLEYCHNPGSNDQLSDIIEEMRQLSADNSSMDVLKPRARSCTTCRYHLKDRNKCSDCCQSCYSNWEPCQQPKNNENSGQ